MVVAVAVAAAVVAAIRKGAEEDIRSVVEGARKGAADFKVVAEQGVEVIERVTHRNEAAIIRMVGVPLREADTRTAIRGAVAHAMPGAAIPVPASGRAREVM